MIESSHLTTPSQSSHSISQVKPAGAVAGPEKVSHTSTNVKSEVPLVQTQPPCKGHQKMTRKPLVN